MRPFTDKLQERFLKWQREEDSPYFIQRRNWLETTITRDSNLVAQINTELKKDGTTNFESFIEIVSPVNEEV